MARASPCPSMPQEIYDAIIDHLAATGDDLSLRACALASRQLRPRSQAHLFRTIVLGTDGHIQHLGEVFVGSPHLTSHVEAVRISLAGSSPAWTTPAATRLLSHLKGITSLTIAFPPRLVYGRRVPDTLGPAALAAAHLTTLHTLALDACTFQTRAAHDALLRSLPALRTLSLGPGVRCWECLHYRARSVLRSPGNGRVELPHVEHLAFDCVAEAGRCVVQSAAPVRLRTLGIKGAGASQVQAEMLGDVIACASAVAEVDVDLTCPAIPEVAPESTVPTKARRFVFVADADTALADRLEALFEALPASDVDVLRLRLDARACLGADWATVGAGLGTRSCAVKSVSLAFAPDVGRNVIERVVGDLRMGLREWQGEDTRTFVDVE